MVGCLGFPQVGFLGNVGKTQFLSSFKRSIITLPNFIILGATMKSYSANHNGRS